MIFKDLKAFLLKILTRKKINNFELLSVKTILFLRYDRIGDMVLTTPVFREFKKAFPAVNLFVLASKANADVISNNPYVDRVFLNNKNNFFKDLLTLFALRKMSIDVCVEFDHSVIPHAILRLKIIRPKKIISVFKSGRYGISGSELELYDFYVEKKNKEHFRDIWLRTLEPFGIAPESNKYDLFPSQAQLRTADDFLGKTPSRKILIGLNLEGAVKGKKIKVADAIKIIEKIQNVRQDTFFIILTSPKNHFAICKDPFIQRKDGLMVSYETIGVMDMAALISKLDMIITPDTSIVHIASAYNLPVVSVHENNIDSYNLFRPTSSKSHTVFSKKSDSLEGFSLNNLVDNSLGIINGIEK